MFKNKFLSAKFLFHFLILLTFSGIFALTAQAAVNVSSVSFSAPQTTGGTDVRGVITLDGLAPAGGYKVALSSNNSAAVFAAVSLTEPGGETVNITVPAGKNSASFIIKTSAVAQDTMVTVTAGTRESPKTATFTIIPPVFKSLTLSSPNVVGGQTVSGKVALSGPAPKDGVIISLSSSNAKTSVPAKFGVPAGQTTASFDIKTVKLTGNDEQATIEAVSPTGVRFSAPLTVTLPLVPEIISLEAPQFVLPGDRNRIRLTLDRTLTASHQIRLTSNNPAIEVLGSSLLPGESSYSFEFTPKRIGTVDTPVIITAVSGNSTKTATVTIRPLFIQSITMAANSVTGGRNLRGTITLTYPKNDPLTISLTTLDGSVTVPSSLTLRNGQTVDFETFTQPVQNLRNVQVSARLDSEVDSLPNPKTVNFSVVPVAIESLTLSEAKCNVTNGECRNGVVGTITLNSPAGLEGMSFSITQSTPSVTQLTTPQIVLIPSGQSSAQFNIQLPTSGLPNAGIYTIRATSGSNSNKQAQLEIERTFISVESVNLSLPEVQGGNSVNGTVTIKQFRVGATRTDDPTTTFSSQIDLTTNSAQGSNGLGNFTIPGVGNRPTTRITIPAGQTTGTFTFIPAPVTSEKTIQIMAAPFGGGAVISAPLVVKPPTLESFTVSQTSLQGGQETQAQVRLSGHLNSSGDIRLTSSNPDLVTIVQGSSSSGNTFPFIITASPNITSTQNLTITVALANQTQSVDLTLSKPSVLTSISFPEQNVFSGVPTKFRVELDAPAPRGGSTISYGSSNTVVIPFFQGITVIIPEGQTSATVDVTPRNVSTSTPISVFATHRPIRNGQDISKSTSVKVEPLNLTICNNSGVVESFGSNSVINCTLTISNSGMLAPENGLQISVESSNPSAISVPSTITIPAGQNSVNVQFNAQTVTQNTDVEIKFSIPNRGFPPSKFRITPQ